MWLWVVVIVVLIGIVTVVAVGSGDSLADVYDDRPDRTIPVGRPLRADDLGNVRFTTAVRGYRMDEVDALLARMRADLLAREASAQQRDGDRHTSSEPGGSSTSAGQSDPSPDEPWGSAEGSHASAGGSHAPVEGPHPSAEGSHVSAEGPHEARGPWQGPPP